jgi:predicted nucleotidyltransferase
MAGKPVKRLEHREIVYDAEHWTLLEKYRQKSMTIMEALEKAHLETIVHGSIARGDVTKKSDIDIFIQDQPSSFIVETALEKADILVNGRVIVQATPTYTMKAYLELDENASVSFPLAKMRKVEREFYRFGGEVTLKGLRDLLRRYGVDKRLMLIEPTKEGHRESSIIGREEEIAKLLGISVETVSDRVRTLTRRGEVGRTGVFIKRELPADETFEMVLKRLADQNPAVRRRLSSLS